MNFYTLIAVKIFEPIKAVPLGKMAVNISYLLAIEMLVMNKVAGFVIEVKAIKHS